VKIQGIAPRAVDVKLSGIKSILLIPVFSISSPNVLDWAWGCLMVDQDSVVEIWIRWSLNIVAVIRRTSQQLAVTALMD
jgi:hypothetical protein